jgi:uncharacterized glyoxalase superfamily protein PhnB
MTPAAKPSPIPNSYRRVTPSLTVVGAVKALEFYGAVFGATERMRFPGPDGTIYAEIQIGDSVIIVEDEDPQRGTKAPPPGGLPGSPAALFICVEDVDAVIARAVELGATAASGGRPVLRRPGRPHRGPVRARVDRRVAHRGRDRGGDDAADGRAVRPGRVLAHAGSDAGQRNRQGQ